jgi:hypothetical protein
MRAIKSFFLAIPLNLILICVANADCASPTGVEGQFQNLNLSLSNRRTIGLTLLAQCVDTLQVESVLHHLSMELGVRRFPHFAPPRIPNIMDT